MSSSLSLCVRRVLVAFTWVGILVMACRGEPDTNDEETAAEEFRGGTPPPGLDAEVEGLRLQGITLTPSNVVGTLPGGGQIGPTGQAGYSIPLELPPGAGGLVPSMSLSYSSGGGNGLFGLGWSLNGFSSIDRCGKTIADDGAFGPVELDEDDALCMDGQRLILVAGTHLQPGAEYRTTRDPFARIRYGTFGSSPFAAFEVEWPNGRVSRYGTDHFLQSGQVRYSWLLDEIRDRYDNTIEYLYISDGGSSSLRPWMIEWEGGRVELIAVPGAREDQRRGYRFGEAWAQLDRIDSIEVSGAGGVLLHTYNLGYEYVDQWSFGEAEPEPWSPHTRSTLRTIEKCDAAGICLPATTFDYIGSGTGIAAPNEDLPGMPAGIRDLSQDQLEHLKWARKSIAGDFNGDLEYETIAWNDLDGEFEVFRHGNDQYGDSVLALATPDMLPPSWDEIAVDLDAEAFAYLPLFPYDHPYTPNFYLNGLHRVQPTLGHLVVNFDNDRKDDILYPYGGGRDAWGVGYADELRIASNAIDNSEPPITLGFANTTVVDDGSSDPIYNVVPLDHDGNGLTDLWMCRGQGFKTSHWVLALNEGDNGTLGFSFHDTNVGCSIHDELNVVSMRGTQQNLLVIPAYPWDPAEMQYPGSDTEAYLDNVDPIDEGLRVFYLELQFDQTSGEDGELVDSGLPRDLFQRWHDRDCHNRLADWWLGFPAFSAGLSLDRHVDLNGDGYVDILRAELATDPAGFPGAADNLNNIDAIRDGLEADGGWGLGIMCETDLDDQDLVLRGWINTGEGFVRGDVFYTFEGNPHANFWLNIQGGQLTDRDRDGYTDMVVPSTGIGGAGWKALMSAGGALDCDGQCFAEVDELSTMPPGWPAYNNATAGAWKFHMERSFVVQTRSVGGILLDGARDGDPDPERRVAYLGYSTYHGNGLRLMRATNGLGHREDFTYGCVDEAPSSLARPATAPRGCVTVATRHAVAGRPTVAYEYGGAVIDQHGRGFVGFEHVTQSNNNSSGIRDTVVVSEYDLSYDPALRDYPRAAVPVRTRVARRFENSTGSYHDVRCRDIDPDDWEVVISPEIGGQTWFAYPSNTHSYGQAVEFQPPSSDLPDCDDLTPDHEAFTEQTRNVDGTVTFASSTTRDGEEIEITPSQFVNDETNWFVGKPQRVEVRSCVTGSCTTRTTAFTYNVPTHTLVGLTREPDAAGTSLLLHTQLVYNPSHGRVSAVIASDAFGESRQQSIIWDAEGRLPLTVTNAEGHTSYLLHDEASGVLWAHVAANGLSSITDFDGFYRPVEERIHDRPLGPNDGRTEIAYFAGPEMIFGAEDAAMRVQTSQFPYGQRVVVELDAMGREIRRRWKKAPDTASFPIALPAGGEATFYGDDVYVDTVYDEYGRVHDASHPTLVGQAPDFWTRTDHDIFGRPTRRIIADLVGGPVSAEETWNYVHGAGLSGVAGTLRTEHTDADGNTRTTVVDVDGRTSATQDALGTSTCFEYGAFGVLESVARNCAGGAIGPSTTTTYTPDTLGRIVAEADPSFGTTTTTYTGFGEIDVTTDAEGIVIDTDYDSLGRPIARDENGEGISTWDWDTERIGMLYKSRSADAVSRSYHYGSFGQLYEARTVAPTAANGGAPQRASEFLYYGPGGLLSRIEFDADGRDPDFKVDFEYDELANLRSVHKASDGTLYWGSRQLSLAGQVEVEEYGNGVITTNTYAPDTYRAETIHTQKGASMPLQHLEYDWTPAGDLLSRSDTAPATDQVETFQHDALHRLTRWGVSGALQYAAYDELGNIESKTGPGLYSYDASMRVETTHGGTRSYDFLKNGNLAGWGTTGVSWKTLTWTPLDMVRTLTASGQTLSYRYDADGVRTFRTDGAAVTVRASELFERRYGTAGPTTYTRIPTGDGRIAAEVQHTPFNCVGNACDWNSVIKYVHDDHLGSSNVLSDGTGKGVGGVNYDPWGRPRNKDNWKLYLADSATTNVISGFTGHQPEMEGGLINMRGRMYDPLIGRFASVDPIVSAPLSSQGWTPYSYVFNQPLSMVDPSGYTGLGGGSSSGDSNICVDADAHPDDTWSVCMPTGGGGGGVDAAMSGMFGSGISFGHNGVGNGGTASFGLPGFNQHNLGLAAYYSRSHRTLNRSDSHTQSLYAMSGPPFTVENSIQDEGDAMARGDHLRAEEIRRGREQTLPVLWEIFKPDGTDDVVIGLALLWVARPAAPLLWGMRKVASLGRKMSACTRVTCDIANEVLIGGGPWRVFRVGERACRKGCEDTADAVQKAIGGEIKSISPRSPHAKFLGGVKDIDGAEFRNPAGPDALGWSHHRVVVKDGRVYDALTGPEGQAAADYKARWEYADGIEWGF
jgi:RHS repeat-associated protein